MLLVSTLRVNSRECVGVISQKQYRIDESIFMCFRFSYKQYSTKINFTRVL